MPAGVRVCGHSDIDAASGQTWLPPRTGGDEANRRLTLRLAQPDVWSAFPDSRIWCETTVTRHNIKDARLLPSRAPSFSSVF